MIKAISFSVVPQLKNNLANVKKQSPQQTISNSQDLVSFKGADSYAYVLGHTDFQIKMSNIVENSKNKKGYEFKEGNVVVHNMQTLNKVTSVKDGIYQSPSIGSQTKKIDSSVCEFLKGEIKDNYTNITSFSYIDKVSNINNSFVYDEKDNSVLVCTVNLNDAKHIKKYSTEKLPQNKTFADYLLEHVDFIQTKRSIPNQIIAANITSN